MTNFDEILPYVIPELDGCPEPLILQAMSDICIDLHRQTQIFDIELRAINLQKDVTDYRYDVGISPKCFVIDQIISVHRRNSPPKDPTTDIDPQDKGVRLTPGADFERLSDNTIRLIEKPTVDIDRALFISVVLRPQREARELPDEIFERWYDTFAQGIMARLMRHKRRSWSDPEMAREYKAGYKNGIGEIRIWVNRGGVNSSLSVNLRTRSFIVENRRASVGTARPQNRFNV